MCDYPMLAVADAWDRVISEICDFVCTCVCVCWGVSLCVFPCCKRKMAWAINAKLVHVCCMAGPWHALIQRSKGHISMSWELTWLLVLHGC